MMETKKNIISNSSDNLKNIMLKYKKEDLWNLILSQLSTDIRDTIGKKREDEDEFIALIPNTENSIFSLIEEKIDLENYYKIEDFWNESVQEISDDIEKLEEREWEKSYDEDFLKYADAAASFTFNTKYVIPWYNVDKNTYSEIRNIDKFYKALLSNKNLQFTRELESDWIKLIMPKNTRRVEVEDLNRNFWVIGQVISQILDYLFGKNAPISNILKKIIGEIPQLWENVGNLWLKLFLLAKNNYQRIETYFIPVDSSDSYTHYLSSDSNNFKGKECRYDKMDQVGNYSIGRESEFLSTLANKFGYLINQNPDSNLIIIPYIRQNNYKANYYSKVIFPGVIFYDRNAEKKQINIVEQPGGGKQELIVDKFGQLSYYVFKTSDEDIENNWGGGAVVSVSVKEDSNSIYLQDSLYAAREEFQAYRLTAPFSKIQVIEEEKPRRYYSALRFIPQIKTHYKNGIVIDDLKIEIYDATRKILIPNLSPILTYSLDESIKSYDREESIQTRVAKLNYQKNLEDIPIKPPFTDFTEGNKFYLGELVSWYGNTQEIEKWDDGELVNFSNSGVLIKIGNFLPKGTLNNESGNYQKFTYGKDVNFNGTAEVRHQSHTISAGKSVEKTAYEVNLNLVNPNGLAGRPAPSGYKSRECNYYYPKFNVNKERWDLVDSGTNEPLIEDVINNGLNVITDYLSNDKTSITSDIITNIEGSTYTTIDSYKVNHNLELDKIIYFIGAIGLDTWDNKSQIYWAKNLLFGIFIYIPKQLIQGAFRGTLEQLIKKYPYKEFSSGYILFRKEINKVEINFSQQPGGRRDDFFYVSNSDRWRLPKIFPLEESVSAIEVQSERTKKKYYLPLTQFLKNLYLKNKSEFLNRVSQYKNILKNESSFKQGIISDIINKAAGTWTVFDGYTNVDSNFTSGSQNKQTVLDNNIEKYNKDNTNRQVCHMDFSINTNENSIDYNTVYLRERSEGKIWSTRGLENEIALKNVVNENITISQNKVYGQEIWGIVWQTGLPEGIKEFLPSDFKIRQLAEALDGVDISSYNYKENPDDENSINKDFIDWDLIKDENKVKFVILRAGYGNTQDNTFDGEYISSYNECRERNIPVGAYWHSYAISVEEAEKEASIFINTIKEKQFEYPLYLNFSKTNNESIDNSRIGNAENIIKAFIEKVKNAGYLCGLYYNPNYNNKIGLTGTDYFNELQQKKILWCANWTTPSFQKNLAYGVNNGIWQWSNGKGAKEINGFNNDELIGRSLCFYDYPNYIKTLGLNNFEKQDKDELIKKPYLKWIKE